MVRPAAIAATTTQPKATPALIQSAACAGPWGNEGRSWAKSVMRNCDPGRLAHRVEFAEAFAFVLVSLTGRGQGSRQRCRGQRRRSECRFIEQLPSPWGLQRQRPHELGACLAALPRGHAVGFKHGQKLWIAGPTRFMTKLITEDRRCATRTAGQYRVSEAVATPSVELRSQANPEIRCIGVLAWHTPTRPNSTIQGLLTSDFELSR